MQEHMDDSLQGDPNTPNAEQVQNRHGDAPTEDVARQLQRMAPAAAASPAAGDGDACWNATQPAAGLEQTRNGLSSDGTTEFKATDPPSPVDDQVETGLVLASSDAASDPLASRMEEGTLFGSALHLYARMLAGSTDQRCRLVNQMREDLRQLCGDGVSPIEIEAAERVVVAKMKTLVFDNLMADPRNWDDPGDRFQKMQERASRELERAMKLYLALRKVATSQPGFRVTVAQSETVGAATRTRSVSVEQLPDALPDH